MKLLVLSFYRIFAAFPCPQLVSLLLQLLPVSFYAPANRWRTILLCITQLRKHFRIRMYKALELDVSYEDQRVHLVVLRIFTPPVYQSSDRLGT